MTSINIGDVQASTRTPINPYLVQKSKDNDKSKEDFMSLVAGSISGAVNNNTNNNTNALDSFSEGTKTEDITNTTNSYSSVKERISESDFSDSNIDVEKVSESIEEYEDDVKANLTEKLDISEQELTEAMENLGLSFIDLTQPSNLSALITEIKGSEDTVNLLLDTSVRDIFDVMGELTGELFEETGLDTEGLISVVGMEAVNEEISPELSTILDSSDEISKEISVEPAIENIAGAPVSNQNEIKEDFEAEENTDDTSSVVDVINSKIQNSKNDSNSTNSGTSENNNSNGQAQMASQSTQTSEPINASVLPNNEFSQAIADVETTPEVPTYTSVDTADVIDQIVTQARTTISTEVRSMELELNPHNLGRMLMQVSESEGQITARFVTQNESVKSALEVAITSLVEKLNEQGVKVDAVEVSVGTHEFEENLEKNFADDARESFENNANEQQNKDNRSRGGIHLGNPEYMEGAELSEEEKLAASIMRTYGNTVNFTA